MPWTLEDGPPEGNATHIWTPYDAAVTPPPTINNPVTAPGTLPWLKLLKINGLRKAPEKEDNREGLTFGVGEMMYPPRVLGKTLVYEIEARGDNDWEVTRMVTGCLNGFSIAEAGEGLMTMTPYASIGGNAWTFNASVLDVDPGDGFTFSRNRVGYFRWKFTIILRMSDPHFYTVGGSSF